MRLLTFGRFIARWRRPIRCGAHVWRRSRRDLPTGKAGCAVCSGALIYSQFDGAGSIDEDVMKQQISGKQAARLAEDMASRRPVFRLVAGNEGEQRTTALMPSDGREQDRKAPPSV